MLSFFSPESLARLGARHPWKVLGVWAFFIGLAIFASTTMSFSEESKVYGTESEHADQLLEELNGAPMGTETIVVTSPTLTVDDAEFQAYTQQLAEEVRGLEDIETAFTYFETGDPGLVSADGHKTLIPVVMNVEQDEALDHIEPLLDVLEENRGEEFAAYTVGDGSTYHEFIHKYEEDLHSAEIVGIPVAAIVLFLVFGAAVAAGIPIFLAFGFIIIAFGVTALISNVFGIGSLTLNMISMIGLAVGIDYCLFIVDRFREERAKGLEKVSAIVGAGGTASRAVLFSGITVIIALAGLFVVPASDPQSMAVGAITVVAIAIAAALTLLPAVISLLGDKINALHLPGRGQVTLEDHADGKGFWGWSANLVMKHPVIAIVASVTVLLAAALPVVNIELGNAGLRDAPDTLDSVKAFNVLDEDFSAGRISPTEIVFEGDLTTPEAQAGIADLRDAINADAAFSNLTDLQTNEDGTLGAMSVYIDGDARGPDARGHVDDLRNEYIPDAMDGTGVEVSVGGSTAETTDLVNTMTKYLPIVMAFVLTLSFILLMMVFRSIVIPIKAIIMNLLSVGAAYGLVVAVFQEGIGAGPMGFQESDTIAAFLPVFMFAVLFGLSMDYHVFLLSRIQERFHHTGDNTGSVSFGLRSTAQVITGAAAIMMVVFAGFSQGDMLPMQQMGFGLAVAVFLDATIVRTVLVPASMRCLGDANWYFPSWLSWLPEIRVEGGGQDTHDDGDDTPTPNVGAPLPQGA